jgi:hypothetical protein
MRWPEAEPPHGQTVFTRRPEEIFTVQDNAMIESQAADLERKREILGLPRRRNYFRSEGRP